MSVTLDLYVHAVCAMRKKFTVSFDVRDSFFKNRRRGCGVIVVGSVGVCVWRESGVRLSVLCGAFYTDMTQSL
jgi:hypothetical protein